MRPAVVPTVLGLTLAVAAPTTWALTRPEATAGAPVEQALRAPPTPSTTEEAPRVVARSAVPAAPEQRPAPVRLAVPARGVDTVVDPSGVGPDGQMALPADVDRVGWYRFGPAPGDEGSAVLAGHVDDREQGLGALAPLRDAAEGDEVVLTDAAGTETRWRIVSREVLQKQVLPLDRLFARQGPPRLTLITCGGPFLAELGSYRDNVVVVAEPVR